MNIQALIKNIDEKLQKEELRRSALVESRAQLGRSIATRQGELEEFRNEMPKYKLSTAINSYNELQKELDDLRKIKQPSKVQKQTRAVKEAALTGLSSDIKHLGEIYALLLQQDPDVRTKEAAEVKLAQELEQESARNVALGDEIALSSAKAFKITAFQAKLKEIENSFPEEISFDELVVDFTTDDLDQVISQYAVKMMTKATSVLFTEGSVDERLNKLKSIVQLVSLLTLFLKENDRAALKKSQIDIRKTYCDLVEEKYRPDNGSERLSLETIEVIEQYIEQGDISAFLNNLPVVGVTETKKEKKLSNFNYNVALHLLNDLFPKKDTSNSDYKDLYASIENMREHGTKIHDLRVIKLATRLRDDLSRFEENPQRKNVDVKNQFKIDFLATLHSEDAAFYKHQNPIKNFLGRIYKALYTNLFGGQKPRPPYFFFSTTREKNVDEVVAKTDRIFAGPKK